MTDDKRPILFVADDEPETIFKLEQDLNKRYADRYQVVSTSTEEGARDAFARFQQQEDLVAVLLVGCRVNGCSGVDLLNDAGERFPDAKRLLIAAYDEKDEVIESLGEHVMDNYLLKPFQVPEEDLFPVVDDLLEDWQMTVAQDQDGIRIVGYRWSPHTHQIKNFLARNLVPYRWMEIEETPEARQMVEEAGLDYRRLPVIFFPDGTYLARPPLEKLAEKVGLQQQAESRFYDLVVVGGGPAGLSAAVYGASEGLQTLLIEAEAPGGQAGQSSKIENYLGFPSGLSGNELTRRAVAQAQRFGVEILTPQEATGISLRDRYRLVHLADGSQVPCHVVLISAGVSYRRLEVPGEDRLTGAGVYYGTVVTEALSCTDKEVFILGGGNSAGQAAMYLSNFARQITILNIGGSLKETMSQYLMDQIESTDNVNVRNQSTITELHGEEHLEAVTIENQETKKSEVVPAVALFIYIGATPRTDWLGDLLARDEQGYILTGQDVPPSEREQHYQNLGRAPFFLESSVPGVFAAGDIRYGSVKRIASGVGEGAMAVTLIHRYLSA